MKMTDMNFRVNTCKRCITLLCLFFILTMWIFLGVCDVGYYGSSGSCTACTTGTTTSSTGSTSSSDCSEY